MTEPSEPVLGPPDSEMPETDSVARRVPPSGRISSQGMRWERTSVEKGLTEGRLEPALQIVPPKRTGPIFPLPHLRLGLVRTWRFLLWVNKNHPIRLRAAVGRAPANWVAYP
jgi:hypothetical protein